ncbi:mucin-2 [Vombatus ursinus]|uniref:mucin-2 n=1 Tax=Vombatus ursinus TaxID=29139 RepID=UPI000FFDB000|nr:mucin-2 [Vombatus ursinus]
MGLSLASLLVVWLALSSVGTADLQKGRSLNHHHDVCSTWGNNHYKTFDGDVYQFPGLCDYNFASDCRDAYKEFAVHIQRGLNKDHHPQITYILVTIKDVTIYLTHQLVVVNGAIVHVPYYSSGLLVEKNDVYTKIYSRVGFALMWNLQDSLMLELAAKFRNHTCGLCGDYNGRQTDSEFNDEGVTFSPIEFGNMQKINQPDSVCADPEEKAPESCSEHRTQCENLLKSAAFEDCQAVVPVEMYILACMQDLCQCEKSTSFCLCSTVSEFSRQCSHAGGRPRTWRTDTFCTKTCPGNMVYLESGSPCMDTCSHLEVSSLCEEHYMDGCFCPEGTVYDDITGKGCIQVNQCSCKLRGHLYAPGKQITSNCEECVCNAGRWVCEDLSCPGTCALEGGAHITTFDGKKYTFHGDCYYILAKGDSNDSYALLGELAPCGSTDKQTCLKTVVLLTDKKKNIVAFKSDGRVLLNDLEVHLPHIAASFSIFKPSSYHLIVHTAYGLRLQIQLVPLMQLFMTMDQAFQGKVQGLCGNFNGLESDDFKTAGGLIEATGSGFANTWKAQSSCHDKLDWLDDPCSLNIENANYAEHWCSLLKKTETPFARCHSVVDPGEYYKRCKYDTCNCQNNEDCMCAALSSYARACSTKGVMLWGWRERVCNKDVASCPNSQIFLYNLTTCQQTCRSLSEADKHCLRGFAPVDGCGCPEGTYVDEKGRCVLLSKCSCYHRGLYLEAGEVILKEDERCVCQNARLRCTQVKLIGQSCASPKIHVDCDNLTALTTRTPHPVSCQSLGSGYYQTECVSGCMCPPGLIDDGQGGCVVEEECPCVHNKVLYSPGQKITVDCNTCTCQRGSWVCTKSVCHGTCSIYGSGHYITFDGKYYDFDGHCSYVAAQDYCGQKGSRGSFSIITENVPCGTTGVTCSKAIKIFLGRTELKLEEKHRWVIYRDVGEHVSYTTREVGQYLVIEASNGIIVIWDKRTTIFIKLAPTFKGAVCGLCGDFDDRSSNDFTTRDHMIVTSALDFGNSWKEAHTCPDVDKTFEPCAVNPHRRSWAEKQCSILKSQVFGVCHSKVDPAPFYDACVHDSCSCDTGGDCECFCAAVASYAQECTKEGACVFWRSPDLCPIFCDYYNPPNECEWHYEPCGNRSFETCRTINGIHSNISVSYLEGCYPRCPPKRPVFDEDKKKCVPADQCGCYVNDEHYEVDEKVPTEDPCQSCICTSSSEVSCKEEIGAVINQTQNGSFCFWELCGPNGTVTQYFNICAPTSPPTVLTVSTTSVTTTSPTTTFPTTTTSRSTEICCFWSDWINEDHPNTGSNDGDWERFYGVCSAPENIECRSAEEPHLSWDQLGQKVQCDVSFGLICHNEDQFENGPFGLCYDYEIRVNCCLPMDHCPTTTTSITTTPGPTTTVTTVSPTTGTTPGTLAPPTPTTVSNMSSTSTTKTPTIPTTTETPTTTTTTTITEISIISSTGTSPSSHIYFCCYLNDTYYDKGDVVYNWTHGDYCYFVNCSLDCQLQIFNWSCPSTPQPSPTPTPTPAPSPSKPTTPSPGCPDFVPPRQENETWWLCNCTMAVCKHDNTVEIFEKVCDPPPKPVCSNGLNPVWVLDPDGCCGHWECDCYCTGWGDPHYTTFDGLYYSYQGNCTYVLVEEISPTVDDFGIYIDNYHCDINDKVSCPRTLIVRHETQEVLIKTIRMAPMKVQVLVNKHEVALPYQKYGVRIYEAGINYVVNIPELGVLVSYNGLSFAIKMPYNKFGNNTKGQCGTCTNSTADDCMLPSGKVISDCEIMADEWLVNDPSKPHCPHVSSTTIKPEVTPTAPECVSSPLCELIKSSLFVECHKYAPSQHYYDACVFDSCFVPDSGVECASLQTYAALCAQEGICISWREHTNGVCDVTCPSHKEYKACGPVEELTCKSSSQVPTDNRTTEGCFCPEGTISFAPGIDVCVPTCGCVGPDSVPREFGERFQFDCKNCVCLEGGSGIVCEAKQCSQLQPESCWEEGTYPVIEVDPRDTCCNMTYCKCNSSLCQTELPVCSVGFELKTQLVPGKCCPVHSCEPKGVCVLGQAEYKPGSPVYSDKCRECICTEMVNASTHLNIISCSHVPCNISCKPGFEPVKVPDQCCPTCKQTQCVMYQTGSLMLLQPGEMKSDPQDNCTIYSCMKLQDQLISSVSNITCPDLDLGSCQPGTIKLKPNGCCKTCTFRNETLVPCSTVPRREVISVGNCRRELLINQCEGACGTFAKYSEEAQSMDHQCSCCKEVKTSQKVVELACEGGGTLSHKYTYIESCGCQDTVCGMPLESNRRASLSRTRRALRRSRA